MSTHTKFVPRGADSLPRIAPGDGPDAPGKHGRLTAVLSGLGILALVVGVPTLLVLFVGNPLPTTLPDSTWLEADLTAGTLIKVFAVLVWIVWAHFVICLATEFRAARAGRMPGLVPLGGGTQVLARRLVAGVLLLAGAATMSGHAPSVAGAPDTKVVSERALQADEMRGTPGIAGVRLGEDGGLLAGTGTSVVPLLDRISDQVGEQTSTAGRTATLKFYEVKPPQGRNYDCLWDIADRTLGDPLRYKEIFDLNRDRIQPDGRRLVDADLIQPGWQLVLPADAKGADVQDYHATMAPSTLRDQAADESRQGARGLASVADVSDAVTGGQGRQVAGLAERADSALAETSRTAGADAAGSTTSGSDTAVAAPDEGSGTQTGLGELLTGGGMVLAGALLALSTRRGPYGTPDADDEALRLAANPGRADLLDRALRILSQGRRSQRLELPDAVAVYVNDDAVVVHVAGTPEPPPAPWVVTEQGRAWTVTRADLEGLRPIAPAPWPALVSIAESHGYDLLVDLEYAPGLISLGGNAEVSREVALSLAVDLVTHPWSDAVEVTLVGFGDDLSDLAPDRITSLSSIEEAVEQARRTDRSAQALLRTLGVDGVLAGRAAGHGDQLHPRVLILSGPPSEAQAALFGELAAQGRSVLTTVCVGNTMAARWRFVTDAGGGIDLGALGMSGAARRISHEGAGALRALLRGAATEAAQRTAEAAVGTPAGVLAQLAPATRPSPSAPARAGLAESLAQVLLLGPVEVRANGPVQPARQAVLTELVALVALHPEGVHESVLRASLWPRGVDDDVVRSTLAGAQQWLAADQSGGSLLAAGADGRWSLDRRVHVDWAGFVARAGSDDLQEQAAALSVARGPAFSATPPGRYRWLAWHQSAREARVLATALARTVAGRLQGAGDAAGAERALRQGLTLVPTAQALWRDLIRMQPQPGSAGAVVAEMRQALGAGMGVGQGAGALEPETAALVQHTLPAEQAGGGPWGSGQAIS